MRKILLAALCAAIVISGLAMPAAADGEQTGQTVNDVEQAGQAANDMEQAGQTVSDVEQAGQSAVTTIPPLGVQTIPPAAVQTIPPLGVQTVPPAAVQTFSPHATLRTIPPLESQTIPPMAVQTIPPLAVQTFSPYAALNTIPPLGEQFSAPDVQVGVSGNSHVYVLGPDGSIRMADQDEEQSVLRAVGLTASSLADGQQGQYSGSLFSTEGAAGSYALTALSAFLGAAGGSALTWAIINRKKKNDKGDGKK